MSRNSSLAVNLADRRVVTRRVVTIGGGTGPFALLSALKNYPCAITAIVTMADSGGSSRRLMDEFGQLPFGDLRQALVALAQRGALWRDMFNFRFRSGAAPSLPVEEAANASKKLHLLFQGQTPTPQGGVGGHSLGNLILSALEEMNEGNLLWALEDAHELLGIAGRVLPVTLEHATLCAELCTGEVICGESEIDRRGESITLSLPPIQRIFLREDVQACQEALHAIRRADVIVLGPGDLYTSVLPNLLVRGVPEVICASSAHKIYVCNLMTKHGETDGFRVSDFVRELHHYLGGRIDRVIVHDGTFPSYLLGMYQAKKQRPVVPDLDAVRELGVESVVDDLLAIQGNHLVRHNAPRLIEAIFAPSSHETIAPLSPMVEEKVMSPGGKSVLG